MILSGNWELIVRDGNVSQFRINFTAVAIDGSTRHTYELGNASVPAVVPVLLEDDGTVFPLMADIRKDHGFNSYNIQLCVSIAKLNTLRIIFTGNAETTEVFGNKPIYGVVDSPSVSPPAPP